MEEVIRYKCDFCGELMYSKEECETHEDKHRKINKANEMLEKGCTLQQIQDECNIWDEVPEHLKNVNKDNCFIISYWQCCNKPAYQIVGISFYGDLRIKGCGSWTGYYGGEMRIKSSDLKDPRPKEELYVDQRYFDSLRRNNLI